MDFLFSNKILIPITEEFLRYHKSGEKYDKSSMQNLKERDATKIKYVINNTQDPSYLAAKAIMKIV